MSLATRDDVLGRDHPRHRHGVSSTAVAASVTGLLALSTYLLDYLGRAWEPAATISRLSPFHYFEPMTVITTQSLSAVNATVLIAVGIAGAIASYVEIGRRDI